MPSSSSRFAWIDNLRTTVIVLVVNMHACVTYSHVGGWYVTEQPEPSLSEKIPFIFWQGHLQAFFMGLLFFLAGVFALRSLERHGAAKFLRERWLRLGLPALLYMVLIHPFIVYVLLGAPRIPNRPPLGTLYADYVTSVRVLRGNGPLWFALALLAFCLALVAWRTASRQLRPTPDRKSSAPSPTSLLVFGCVLVVTTFAIRLVQPIGTDVLNFQLCFFPQYVAAFIAGVAAGRDGWLQELATARRARVAGWLGLIGGPMLLAGVIALGGPPPERGSNPYAGGWQGQAFGLAMWEQLAGLGLGLGMLALFRARLNRDHAIARWLSERAFGVYVLHAPILVALTPLLRPLHANAFVNVALLTALGLIASYAAADLARRIPGLRAIL
ncbi:MAG: acyltransferase [Verrucomicrobia bacterium]|nr:acyltransferase [Verrucomicrobiota bacterium]